MLLPGTRRWRKRCCAVGESRQKLLSALTVTYVHSVLKSALEHAVREDELPRNVARNVKTATRQPRRFRPLTAAEARQFLDAARADRLHALYVLALRTGLRKGELLGLHWDDLDLNTGTVAICRSLQRTRTGGLTVLHTKTRASGPRIALPTECVHSLKNRRESQQDERRVAGAAWSDGGLVFTTPTGGPLDPANLIRHFGRLLNRAELRRIRCHDLRHSTATLLLEQGVDLVVIKERLGHAHIGVTASVYAHVRLQRRPTHRSRRPLTLPSKGPEGPPEAFRRAFGRSSATSNPTEISRLLTERRHHPHHRRYLEYSEKISRRLAILQARQKLGRDSPLARLALEHSPGNTRTET